MVGLTGARRATTWIARMAREVLTEGLSTSAHSRRP